MRIRELYLKAFGPFTEKKIPFPGKSECGLVVVYGRNEAGKSSALRAIRDLLYGIHVQSSDDFLHRHADLRVGARLEFADGEELAVMRRKGKKNTLRCYEDREGVAAERLLELTDRIPLSLFENFYGLDHHGLTEGSKALLEDEGELGRALYGAGLGAGNLRAVLESLESEAGALFSPRGKNPRINATMAEWKAIDSQIRSASLNPKDWQEQASRVAEAEAELAALGRSIEQTTRGLSRRVRIRHSLPVLARRRRWLDQVTALPEVRELSGDFEPRLARLRTDRRDAERARERAARSLEKHTARRDVLKPQPRLIEARERIEMRHRGVTGYREIHDQLPRRESELMRLDALIDEALTVVGGTTPDALGTAQRRAFRVPLERSGRIQELASELAGFETRLEAATDEIEEARVARERIENERAASGAIRDPERLRRALVRAERRGDIDERIVSAQREVDALARECGQAARRLGLAASGLDRLERTVTPDDAAIDAFAERFEAAEARVVRAEDDCRRLRTEQGDVAESLARLRAEGAVPSEAELVEHRSRRDSTLRELRRRWLGEGGEVDATGRRALADRVEQRVGEADVLADRLRVDADRVAQQSGLVARSARLLADLELAEDDRARGLEAVASVGVEWAALWERSGVELRRPDEMRSWRRGFEALLARLGQLRVAEAGLNAQREDRDASIADVAEALRDLAERPEPMPDRLDEAVEAGRRVVARLDAAAREFERLDEAFRDSDLRFERAERDRGRALRALEHWRSQWAETIRGLGIEVECRPVEALARLEAIRRLVDTLREREQLADRIAKMRANQADFEEQVAELIGDCSPELEHFEAEPAVLRLYDMLREARDEVVQRAEIEQALTEARQERDLAEVELEAIEEQLVALREEAHAENDQALDVTLEVCRALNEARRGIEEEEARLAEIGAGRSIEALVEESRGLDSDELASEIEALEARLKEEGVLRDRAIDSLRGLRDELAKLDGSARVGELAEAGQAKLATIRRDAERYLDLRLAREILEREIDAYKQRNQAPVLKRAGEMFGLLTRSAYPNIDSDYDERGRARLLAVDAPGRGVPVEGLSSGTRDQLYLALRLATLEESLARSPQGLEPMPLVADDVLVEFDDDRSRATLEVLAQLGQKTQILLFSHHRYVAEIARELGDVVRVIEL